MKKLKRILLILCCVVILCILAHFATRTAPTKLTMQLSGTAGLRVAGSYEIDGNSYSFAGVVPTNFVTEARHLSYAITNLEPKGKLEGSLYAGDELIGSSGTPLPFAGVVGEYISDGSWFHHVKSSRFTTASLKD